MSYRDAGALLRGLRIGRGLKQAYVADRAGMAQSCLSEIEHGKRKPNLGTLERVASALSYRLVVSFEPIDDAGLPKR